MAKKQTAVVYIDTNKIFFYAGKTGDIFRLDLSLGIVSDMDLVNEEKLLLAIDSFCKTNNLEGTNYETLVVFSMESTFEKEFSDDIKEDDAQIQQFIEIVPFEETLSKVYKLNKKTKVIVVNKAIYDAIKAALEKKNFSISQLLPYSVLKEVTTDLASNVNLALIASKSDSYKQFSLINATNTSSIHKEKAAEDKKQNKRVFALVGVFFVLLIILVVLIVTTFSPQPVAKKGAEVLPLLTPTPSIEENSQTSTPSAETTATNSSGIIPIVSE